MYLSYFDILFTRSRSSCDTYKQLLSDAMNQLKNMNKAAVMSNNQSNQFDRLSKAVEQVKTRPIWTPNTTRHQQAELVEQLRKELNKVMVSLSRRKESHFLILSVICFTARINRDFALFSGLSQDARAKYEFKK